MTTSSPWQERGGETAAVTASAFTPPGSSIKDVPGCSPSYATLSAYQSTPRTPFQRRVQQESAPSDSGVHVSEPAPTMSRAQSFWFHSLPGKCLLVAAYLSLNLSLNILNKWTLSLYGFRFPIILSMAHMLFSAAALAPIMCTKAHRDQHVNTITKQWMGLVAIGFFFAINVGFNNVSLLTIPLSLNQVIRSSIPVAAAIGSIFIEHKPPTRQEFMALLILVAGVSIAVWEGSVQKVNATGVMLCVLGTISNGLMMSSIGKLMSEKLDAIRLTFYTAPITCMVLLPFYFLMERGNFAGYSATHSAAEYGGLLLLGCVNALSYNLVHTLVIKATSSVTTTVLGEMKIVTILLLSAMLLGEQGMWTLKMAIGCTTAILGFCMYSHSRLSASTQPQPAGMIKSLPEVQPLLENGKHASSPPPTRRPHDAE